MNSETVRKIVVAGAMAVVVAIGATIFVIRHPAAAVVAQQPAPPPPVAEQAPTTPPQVAQDGAGTARPAATDSSANADASNPASVATRSPAPIQPRSRPVTHSSTTAAIGATAASAETTSPTGASGRADSLANSQGTERKANDATDTASTPSEASNPDGGSNVTATDQQITTDVKSEISRNQSGNGANVDVKTDHGVVTLSGTVPDQSTLDSVKETVARVQGVTSVDASALTIASQVSFAIQQ